MKRFILGFLLASMTAYAATEFGDLTIKGATTSVGNLTTQGFLSANTGIASLNGGTFRLHETNVNGGSKVTVQTVSNLAADYVLTLPPDDGTNNQVLKTDGNGVLTWTDNGEVTLAGSQTLTNKTLTSPIIGTTATLPNQASLQFFETTGGGSNKITMSAPSTLAGDLSLVLPTTAGTTGQVLSTDGSGNLSWSNGAAGSVTDSSTTTFTNKTIDADVNTLQDIDNNEIKAAAAIAVNKLAALTASRVVVTDVSGFVSAAGTTSSEIALLNGQSGTLLTVANSRYATIASQGTGTLVHGTTTEIVLCGPSGSDITYTLPSASSGFSGSTYGSRVYTFVKTTATNNCIIDPNASETINGSTTYTMTSRYCTISIVTDATNWYILNVYGCP